MSFEAWLSPTQPMAKPTVAKASTPAYELWKLRNPLSKLSYEEWLNCDCKDGICKCSPGQCPNCPNKVAEPLVIDPPADYTLVNGVLYVNDANGTNTGQPASFQLGNPTQSQPALGQFGTIFRGGCANGQCRMR
jgi:hypothetical protein